MIPTEFITTCSIRRDSKHGEYLQHFGIHHSLLSIYGVKEEDLRTVKLIVNPDVNLSNREETNEPDYWGFWNYETKRLSLVYPSYIQFAVCFPYGPKSEEDVNRGKCLNLKIATLTFYNETFAK